MIGKFSICVIIPVYNEEKTIEQVISATLKSKCVDEVICVNDGSTDLTLDKIKKFAGKIVLINYKENRGKGFALAQGLKRCKKDIVIFCDADLAGLKEKHFLSLVKELIKNKKIKSILGVPGIKESGKDAFYHLLTGERAFFRKDIVKHASRIQDSGYGVETYLNHIFKKGERKVIVLKGLHHLKKFQKGSKNGIFTSYLKEGLDIAREYAKINGFLTKNLEKELDKISKVKTIKELGESSNILKNKKLRKIFKRYLLNYSELIKSILSS